MLSAKFKVSFVKLSPGIRRALKDILHDAVTSNLTLTAYRKEKGKKKTLVCWKKMKKKKENKHPKKKWKKCYASFRVFFFLLLCYLFHISADIKQHQIVRNRPWFSGDVKRVAGTLPSEDTWQNALWGWLQLRKCLAFYTHITHCLLTPLLQTTLGKKRGAVLNKCHTSLQELHWSLLLCKSRMSWCVC